jgi:hypothetical protein
VEGVTQRRFRVARRVDALGHIGDVVELGEQAALADDEEALGVALFERGLAAFEVRIDLGVAEAFEAGL